MISYHKVKDTFTGRFFSENRVHMSKTTDFSKNAGHTGNAGAQRDKVPICVHPVP